MDRPTDTPSSCLLLDLDQVRKILPILISIATELDAILDKYREQDTLFRQHFRALFTDQGPLISAPERVRSTLCRLYDLAGDANLIKGPLYGLELNNDRAVLACNMLTMLFSTDQETENADNDEEVH